MKVQIKDFSKLLSEVLNCEITNLQHTSKPEDYDDWDSLNQVFLIIKLESFYKIKFNTSSIQKWTCVGDIINDINSMI
jgi:acyl carrier protein